LGQQIRRKHPALALCRCTIRCLAMQDNTNACGLFQPHTLCDEGGDNTTKDIAHAATGHAWVSGATDGGLPTYRLDHAASPL
jgi:hypothetical protein